MLPSSLEIMNRQKELRGGEGGECTSEGRLVGSHSGENVVDFLPDLLLTCFDTLGLLDRKFSHERTYTLSKHCIVCGCQGEDVRAAMVQATTMKPASRLIEKEEPATILISTSFWILANDKLTPERIDTLEDRSS